MQALLLLGGLGGLFLLLSKKGPGKTVAAEVPGMDVPKELSTIKKVMTRFDEVKTLYRMGRLDQGGALKQMRPLVDAVNGLRARKEIPKEVAVESLRQMNLFVQDVGAAQAA
jgi:hypothetical protein